MKKYHLLICYDGFFVSFCRIGVSIGEKDGRMNNFYFYIRTWRSRWDDCPYENGTFLSLEEGDNCSINLR